MGQGCPAELASEGLGIVEVGAVKPSSAQDCAWEPCLAKTNSWDGSVGEISATQVSGVEVDVVKRGVSEIHLAEIRPQRGIFGPPAIPRLGTLSQDGQVLGISHGQLAVLPGSLRVRDHGFKIAKPVAEETTSCEDRVRPQPID